MPTIQDYHAHVYYDTASLDRARRVCETLRDTFAIPMGRMHEKNVGPHPRWSCQLTIPPDKFADVVSWLLLNRDGLTIFVHAQTGAELTDHTKHTLWMGEMLTLDLTGFHD